MAEFEKQQASSHLENSTSDGTLMTFPTEEATCFSSSSDDSDESNEEKAFEALMKDNDDDNGASRDKVWRRADYETRSIGNRTTDAVKEEDEEEEVVEENIDSKELQELPQIKNVRSFQSRISNVDKKAGKGILKSRNRRVSQSNDSFNANVSGIAEMDDDSAPKMKSNLRLKTWSVCSYDSCNGDTRRNYANFLSTAKRLTTAKSFSVFKTRDGEELEVPAHVPDDFEDTQPYGPSDSSSPFFPGNGRKSRRLSLAKSLSRLKSLSLASLGTLKRSKSSHASSKRSRRSLVGRLYDRFFTSKKNKIKKDAEMFDTPLNLDFDVNLDDKDDEEERKIAKEKDMERFQRNLEEQRRSAERQSSKKDMVNDVPDYIPSDMVWDSSYNRGKGGLVNKEPQFIPKGKLWDRDANNGKGGLVNKPVNPATIPGTQIWSKTAFNGQGGIINKRPQKMPKGKVWDPDAVGGKGGLVEATEEQNRRLRKRKEEKRLRRKMRGKEKLKEMKRQSKERREQKLKKEGKFAVVLAQETTPPPATDAKMITVPDKEKEKLLQAVKAESDNIFADLDQPDIKEEVNKADTTPAQEVENQSKNEVTEKSNPPPKVKVLSVKFKTEKEADSKGDEKTATAKAELEKKEAEFDQLKKSFDRVTQVEAKDTMMLDTLEKDSISKERTFPKRRKSSVISASIRKIGSIRSILSMKSKRSLKSNATLNRKRIRKSFLKTPAKNNVGGEALGIPTGHVQRLYSRFENMSQGAINSERESDDESSQKNDV